MTEETNKNEKYEVRLLPIYSCADCDWLDKEVVAKTEYSKGRYTTFCTKTVGHIIIKHGETETPEHYKFPKFCTLQKKE